MADVPTININMDKKCTQCGKKGAMDNGLCLKCVTKNLRAGRYDNIIKEIRDKKGQK